jgi:hypothetical protein
MKSYILSGIAILVCAIPASLLAWWAMESLDLSGVPLALATVFLAMVLSVVFFAGLAALGRATGVIKR